MCFFIDLAVGFICCLLLFISLYFSLLDFLEGGSTFFFFFDYYISLRSKRGNSIKGQRKKDI